jgi:hypothetical protein
MPPSSLLNTITSIPGPTTTTLSQQRSASTLAADKPNDNMYTTSFAFFEALWDAGVEHVFVNLGSDHPSIIEAMVKGAREKKNSFPRILTCPNEVCPSPSLLSVMDTNSSSRW